MTTQLEVISSHSHTHDLHTVPRSHHILGMRVDVTSYEKACREIIGWARLEQSRYVCAATVHMIMESYDSGDFRRVVNGADLVTSDGMPLVWALRSLGVKGQKRVYGPALTLALLAEAQRREIPVGFFGGQPDVLARLIEVVEARFKGLRIVYAESPPFRKASESEQRATMTAIHESGAKLLFVGLGCPKQEAWMAERQGQLQAVMVGVGAAFDFIAGTTPQAPQWMMRFGFEWLFRLIVEPRRLWKRYLKNNPRFVVYFLLQRLGFASFRHPSE